MLVAGGRRSDYQILVSRANERPAAARYPFDLQDSMPCFPLPLNKEDSEPVIDLAALQEQVYSEAALELAIDYTLLSDPALQPEDPAWVKTLGR